MYLRTMLERTKGSSLGKKRKKNTSEPHGTNKGTKGGFLPRKRWISVSQRASSAGDRTNGVSSSRAFQSICFSIFVAKNRRRLQDGDNLG